jgi:hypothetical protein
VIADVRPTLAASSGSAAAAASDATEEYRELRLTSDRGVAEIRYYGADAAGGRSGVVWLPGAHREWRGPARGLYPNVAGALRRGGIASAWVRYSDLQGTKGSTNDALIALSFLLGEGVRTAAAVGHSFGGAVAINAAAAAEEFKTVVTLATQSADTAAVAQLGPRCSILLIHGDADRVLLPLNSAEVYAMAREPKRFELVRGAGHALDEASAEVTLLTTQWLRQSLP